MAKSSAQVRRNRAAAQKRAKMADRAIKAVQNLAVQAGVLAYEWKRKSRKGESLAIARIEKAVQAARQSIRMGYTVCPKMAHKWAYSAYHAAKAQA